MYVMLTLLIRAIHVVRESGGCNDSAESFSWSRNTGPDRAEGGSWGRDRGALTGLVSPEESGIPRKASSTQAPAAERGSCHGCRGHNGLSSSLEIGLNLLLAF